jgi:hypothetical protein
MLSLLLRQHHANRSNRQQKRRKHPANDLGCSSRHRSRSFY